MDKSRRNFIKNVTTSGAAILAAPAVLGSESASKQKATDATAPFKLKYAPSFGMFRQHAGREYMDNIKFCHDMGFTAMFDNGLPRRTPEDQEKLANEMRRLGMDLGPWVLMGLGREPNFVLNTPEIRETLTAKMKEADGTKLSLKQNPPTQLRFYQNDTLRSGYNLRFTNYFY